MIKKRSKKISLLLVLMMLATMFVSVGTASAASINRVSKVVNIDSEYNGLVSTLTIAEDSDYQEDFMEGDSFMVTLPAGVNWNTDETGALVDKNLTVELFENGVLSKDLIESLDAVVSSDQVLDITFPFEVATANRTSSVVIGLGIEVDGFSEGDITATVDSLDSGVTNGTYIFARIADGNSTAKALSVETIGDTNDAGGDIRLEESAVSSLGGDIQEIEFQLPSHFNWNAEAADMEGLFAFSGGFAGLNYGDATVADGEYFALVADNKVTLTINPLNDRTQRGIITVNTPINPDSDANYGDIEVSISGDEVDDADVIVATYSDYGATVTVDEVQDVMAGKYDGETGTVTIEENVEGTLIEGRDIHFEFPAWVKITNVDIADSGIAVDTSADDLDGTSNELDLNVSDASTSSGATIDVTFEISVEGNKTGDIELTVSSKNAGLDESKVVVAKAVAPITAVSAGSKDIKIGVQSQEISDITITENIKGAISDENDSDIGANIFLTLPQGAKFTSKPTVEVTEGNLELATDALDLVTATTSDDRLLIPVDGSSTTASTIKISNIKVTVDRTVPEGAFKIGVGGGALIENQLGNDQGWLAGVAVEGGTTTLDEGEFDTSTAVSLVGGQVVTAAPGETNNTAVFTFGATTYMLNGVEKTMDVAPYANNNRTYMPIRYVAYALGIDDSNIIWDQASQTVTLIKGDKVVQLKLYSNIILINGASVTMDVQVEAANNRTFLPAAFVAQAFGASATWDAAANTVTIK